MRTFKMILSFFFLLLIACAKPSADRFEVHRGTNISHWLSQSERRGDERAAWFTETDVAYLASLGFDHLRIPVDEEQLWDEAGGQQPEAFALLRNGLDWCAEHNLKAIVDLHILRSHHFNELEKPLWTDPEAQAQFVDLWRQLSEVLCGYPNSMVAYELMNEAVADDPDQWNQLAKKAYDAIREKEPGRVLVIGSNRWQTVGTFDDLKVPENDPNILLSFHFYTPMPLTHHQAFWWRFGGEYNGPVAYPGQVVEEADLEGYAPDVVQTIESENGVFNQAVLEAMLEKPLKKARELNLPLYCGEWGCLPSVSTEARLAWYGDMRSNFEKHGIGWATWDYKGSFGLLDPDGNPIPELIDVLTK